MYPRTQLRATLARIHGRPYPAYRDLTGSYDFGSFTLHVEYVQPDPYAPPTRLRVVMSAVPLEAALRQDPLGRLAAEDWLLRRLAARLVTAAKTPLLQEEAAPASLLRVQVPGQQVLERSALRLAGDQLEVRLTVALPASERRVNGGRAAAALDVALPAALGAMFPGGPVEARQLRAHWELLQDQRALRDLLRARGWVAFIADGSLLPRAGGASDLPMEGRAAIHWQTPEALATTVELPHRGAVRGLAVGEGVTLLVGGAYHGKSTVLRALERGVYDHVAGDGRELCLARADAVTLAAEDGRAVSGVDISAFVGPLPGGVETTSFRTLAASGSTSQAASLVEALEMGSRCLLVDEDRSAANFISRDARLRALVPDGEDPVVPFADRVRWLWEGLGVSVVMVAGGAGAMLGVADRVIRLRGYLSEDATRAAATVVAEHPEPGRPSPRPPAAARPRVLGPETFAAVTEGEHLRAKPRGPRALVVGAADVDLGAQSQLVEPGQLSALADMLPRAAAYADGRRTLAEVVREVEADVDRLGLGAISPWAGQVPGEYARPRGFELAAAINRVPGLLLAGDPLPSFAERPRRPALRVRAAVVSPEGTPRRIVASTGRAPAGRGRGLVPSGRPGVPAGGTRGRGDTGVRVQGKPAQGTGVQGTKPQAEGRARAPRTARQTLRPGAGAMGRLLPLQQGGASPGGTRVPPSPAPRTEPAGDRSQRRPG